MIVIVLTAALLIAFFRTVSSFRHHHAKRMQHVGALAVTAVALALAMPQSYLLQKLIGRLLMPAGLLWAALFVAGCWAVAHQKIRHAAFVAVVWLGVTLCGSNYVGSWLMASLELPWSTIDVFKQEPLTRSWCSEVGSQAAATMPSLPILAIVRLLALGCTAVV
ncbi:MAG: hypothetical protein R3E66_21515 [bacterium]